MGCTKKLEEHQSIHPRSHILAYGGFAMVWRKAVHEHLWLLSQLRFIITQ
jgi:hypothetical protein